MLGYSNIFFQLSNALMNIRYSSIIHFFNSQKHSRYVDPLHYFRSLCCRWRANLNGKYHRASW